MTDLPIQKMSVIDLSTSREAIIDRILTEIVKLERPEFEGQRKSIESDILRHKHELNNEHVSTYLQ